MDGARNRGPGRPPKYQREEKLGFAREKARGGTYRHVAGMLGISVGTLHGAYEEYGQRAEREYEEWKSAFARRYATSPASD